MMVSKRETGTDCRPIHVGWLRHKVPSYLFGIEVVLQITSRSLCFANTRRRRADNNRGSEEVGEQSGHTWRDEYFYMGISSADNVMSTFLFIEEISYQ